MPPRTFSLWSITVTDHSECPEGRTNFILVDIRNILQSGFDEIVEIINIYLTLEGAIL